MRIGLSGPHRTGKTTLMYDVGFYSKIPPIEINTADVFKQLGLSPKYEPDIDTLLMVQEKILSNYKKMVDGLNTMIVDRTPIDMIVYTLYNLNGQWDSRVDSYIDKCIDTYHQTIDTLYLVPPGIPIVDSDNSAKCDEDTLEDIYQLFLSTLHTYQIPYTVIKTTDRFGRVLEILGI